MKDKEHQADVVEITSVESDSEMRGSIRINHDVVANIVRLAAQGVPGVVGVGGGGFKEGIAEMFHSRGGVKISTNEADEYQIEVKVILRFGIELAKTGELIQQAVILHVEKMTSKPVARVDVVIDAVRADDPRVADDRENSHSHVD